MAQFEMGPIYDPDEAEKLIETYHEHGDLMGWGDKESSAKHDDEEAEVEQKDDE